MELSLVNWSWQEIISAYRDFGFLLQEYDDLKDRCGVPLTMDINYTDSDNNLISRFWREVSVIDHQLIAMDKEINRRYALVGFMGQTA